MIQKLSCQECGWAGEYTDVLKARNPFQKQDVLTACPKCRSMRLETVCDHEGCKKFAGCGTLTEEGYRWTCFEHRPKPV